jgi:hypothetical protein
MPIKKFFGTVVVLFKDGNSGSFTFSYDSIPEDIANQIPVHEEHDLGYKNAMTKFLLENNYTKADVEKTTVSISSSGVGCAGCSQCYCYSEIYQCGCNNNSGNGCCHTCGGDDSQSACYNC